MPPRSVTALIVVFWLAVVGWAGWRTVEPYLRTREPPPFVIDLLDESGQRTIFWKVYQNRTDTGVAETEVRQDGSGQFVISCHYKIVLSAGQAQAKASVVNRYHVNPKGELRALSAEVRLGALGSSDVIKGQIEGPIRDGAFHPSGQFEFMGEQQEITFDPVDLEGESAVLNPLHPVNRINGLRPGRSWQVPLFDPLALVAAAKLEGKANPLVSMILTLLKSQQNQVTFRKLSAQVLPEPQPLRWGGREEMCWVIDYREDELSAKTWVRQRDGLVLQQEAKLRGDTLLLSRVPNQ